MRYSKYSQDVGSVLFGIIRVVVAVNPLVGKVGSATNNGPN